MRILPQLRLLEMRISLKGPSPILLLIFFLSLSLSLSYIFLYAPPIFPEPIPLATSVLPSGKININTADAAKLTELPGIGEIIAQRIVVYRQEKGPFHSIEEIKEVSGIGEKTFEKLREMITV